MGPVGGSSSCQCQGVAGCASRSPPLPVLSVRDHGSRVLRQCHHGPLSTQGGGVGDRSPALDTVAQGFLRWAASLRIRLAPQFLPGIRNVLADSLSRPHQLPSSAWSLNLDVFRSLRRRWPVMFDLCATSGPSPLLHLFSAYRDPLSAGTDMLLQSWDGLLACAFPPWSVLPRVLANLRVSHRILLTLIAQYWPQRPWFVDLLQLSVAPPVPLSARPDHLFQPRSRRRYPGLHRLALYAWRLSSASPGRLVSPRWWLRRLRWHVVHHRAPPTSSSGRFYRSGCRS